MNHPKTAKERRADKAMSFLIFGIADVFMLYVNAKYWAFGLVFMSVLLALACAPALQAKAALSQAAKQHKLLLHGLLLSGLVAAAILSGLSALLAIGVIVGSFVYLRQFPVFAEMREYMPGASMAWEMIALGIAVIAAGLITLGNGEGRSMLDAALWFAGLAVLFTIAFGLGWVWWTLMWAHSANLKVTERIKVTLRQNNIKETAANVAEVRKVGGERIDQTEKEEAERNHSTPELMRAVLGSGAFSNGIGQIALLPMFLMLGPILLNCSVYPAWVYVAVKTQRPATFDDFVRGIRLV